MIKIYIEFCKMAFWQENYGFIKNVFDGRANKMVENMDECEKSVAEVLADKIYPLQEFRMVKENFLRIAKNIENKEVEKWLQDTSDILMADLDQKTKQDEMDKIGKVLGRLEAILPKVKQTKADVDDLWRAYQYTDELTPHMEWLQDKAIVINKELNSDSAKETETLIERQENIIDQLDKKRKAFLGILQQAAKLISNPKSPEFLEREVKKAHKLWDDTNKMALDQLDKLTQNQEAWESYEEERNAVSETLVAGETEFANIKKIYNVALGVQDYRTGLVTAKEIRKAIEQAFTKFRGTKASVQELATDDVKCEIDMEVNELRARTEVNDRIDAMLIQVDEFNIKLKDYVKMIVELESWTIVGRERMQELLQPTIPITDQDKVLMTMELGDDIAIQMEIYQKQSLFWMTELSPDVDTQQSQKISSRMEKVNGLLIELRKKVDKEAQKYGEDVKHLAEVTNCNKKFEPWIEMIEKKLKKKFGIGATLDEVHAKLREINDLKAKSDSMKKILDDGNVAAHRMSSHGDADKVYAIFVNRWEVVNATIIGWIPKIEKVVELWRKQEEVADKVQAAITDPHSWLELKDLEELFAQLKSLMIVKQKIIVSLNPASKAEIKAE